MINDNELQQLVVDLSKQGMLPTLSGITFSEFHAYLTTQINHLINNNFEQLVQLLYRLDVPEKKLKEALAVQPSNAATVIADFIIQRQLQKIQTRNQFKQDSSDIPDEERW